MSGRRWMQAGAVLARATLGYLSCWPIEAAPQAWEPPPSVASQGAWAPNELLGADALQPHADGFGVGPEDVAIDAAGRVYTGWYDGRISVMTPEGTELDTFATIQGRPLGMEFDASGTLLVADGRGGIVAVDPEGDVSVLVDEVDGEPLVFADDVAVAPDGVVWFSEASTRYAVDDAALDAIEGVPTGRLISFDPETKETTVHLSGLRYANGVAVAPDGSAVVVSETFGYRVRRLWLKGERAGESDLFITGLPGLPDNVEFDADGNLWVAMVKERSPILDAISESVALRKVLLRLPEALLPIPSPIAWVAVFDREGTLRRSLRGSGAFGDVTSANPSGDDLWLGSLTMNSLARTAIPTL